ncbi:hypothetical protein Tco_1038133, partial [Tanacetum coccineum]
MAESGETRKAYMKPSSVTDSSKRKSEKMHDAMTLATWVGNRPRLLNFKPKKNHTKYEVRAGNSKHPLIGAAVSGLGAKIQAEMVFLFAEIEAEVASVQCLPADFERRRQFEGLRRASKRKKTMHVFMQTVETGAICTTQGHFMTQRTVVDSWTKKDVTLELQEPRVVGLQPAIVAPIPTMKFDYEPFGSMDDA